MKPYELLEQGVKNRFLKKSSKKNLTHEKKKKTFSLLNKRPSFFLLLCEIKSKKKNSLKHIFLYH